MEAALNIPRRRDRPVYEYDLPEEIAGQDEYVKKSIGLVKLEMSEEIQAAERANGNQARLAYSWARFSLVEVDGRKLNKGEGEDETVLEHCDPSIRELILSAYADMSTTKEGVTKKFLASRKVKIG
jgi:hypothetical protein